MNPPLVSQPLPLHPKASTTEKSTIENSDPRSNDINILLYPKGRSIDLTPAIEKQQKPNRKNNQKTHQKRICPRGEFRKRSQLGNFQLHRQSPTGHIKCDSTT